MGATEQTTLPYRLTEDTIVLVPLIIVGLYVTLSLIRAIFDYAKSGTKEKGTENNTSDGTAQNNKTQSELFRLITGADQHAEEIPGSHTFNDTEEKRFFQYQRRTHNNIHGDSTKRRTIIRQNSIFS